MRLRLNEQEVIDGICVFVANRVHGNPEEVDVKEITALDNGDLLAVAVAYGRSYRMDSEDILEGIFQFLFEFHDFNREEMVGSIGFAQREGFWAEILVNE